MLLDKCSAETEIRDEGAEVLLSTLREGILSTLKQEVLISDGFKHLRNN